MAVYFDENGNLVDTEINESSNVFMEDPTENFYQPRMDISPTQNFYQPRMDISPTQDYYQSRMDISPTQDYYAQRNFINAPQNYYQPDLTSLRGLDMNKFKGVSDMSVIDETTNDEQDQNYIDAVNKNKESGIMKLIKFLIPGNNLGDFLPKSDPRTINMRNFYGSRYGLTPTGQVASGIMAGYNPVSGGFLNMITGGKYGQPTSFGLANAARKRIEKIANRRAPQTDASRAKIAELQRFARQDTANRARFNNPDVYASADRQGFTDPSTGGFKSAGTNENFSNKTGRGRTGY